MVSGETYSWEDLGVEQEADKDVTLPLVIEYSDHKKENWTLNFDGITADVEANIDGLTVQNYVAEIEGTTITLTIPASIRTTKKLVLDMSKGTTVPEVVSGEQTTARTDGPT